MPSMGGFMRYRAQVLRRADAALARARVEDEAWAEAEAYAAAGELFKSGGLGLLAARCFARSAELFGAAPEAEQVRHRSIEAIMRMNLEGRCESLTVTKRSVIRAVEAMSAGDGPTYVILDDDHGNYLQAAGTEGRYVIEARDVYGEGFRHWRACVAAGGDEPAMVRYRWKCTKGVHRPRCCPIRVRAGDVLSLRDVGLALVEFVATASRTTALQWRDVSSEFRVVAGDDDEIHDIRPRLP